NLPMSNSIRKIIRKKRPAAWTTAGRNLEDAPGRGLKPQRSLVELDLLIATDLVGELLPGRGDGIGTLLGAGLPGIDLGEFVLGYAVILEDARNARLNC